MRRLPAAPGHLGGPAPGGGDLGNDRDFDDFHTEFRGHLGVHTGSIRGHLAVGPAARARPFELGSGRWPVLQCVALNIQL